MSSLSERTFTLASGIAIGIAFVLFCDRKNLLISAITKQNPDSTDVLPDIKHGIEQAIGDTPLIRIKSLSDATGCEILGKAEFLNPGNSPKDRVAKSIIEIAEKEGKITPNSGDMIYEGTVGSTGISLALLCRAKGSFSVSCGL
ncbi:protein of unknown function, partial [Taphrina deformans PYCC 5710]